MRVLVCGGRDYSDESFVFSELDALRQICGYLVIINGGASGADELARKWAWRQGNGVACITEPADWKTHGRAAGPIRNQRMIDEHTPGLVMAFPGGRGTADMMRRAKAAGIEVREPTLST